MAILLFVQLNCHSSTASECISRSPDLNSRRDLAHSNARERDRIARVEVAITSGTADYTA
jgi:hypothetical protein